MAVTNKQLLEAIQAIRDEELTEIKGKLDQVNGRQREGEKVQASLVQWRRDHEVAETQRTEEMTQRTEEMKGEIKVLRGRTNTGATILAITQAVTAIGAFLFGQRGP